MRPSSTTGWGAEFERLARGEIASSTEARLKELLGWGGFSSFMRPSALAAATDADIEPIGQVIGLAAGQVLPGYRRTTRRGRGRRRLGQARQLEQAGADNAWRKLRQRALSRLTQQATLLGANAVIGVTAIHEQDPEETGMEEVPAGQIRFAGTAARVGALRRTTEPVLTLASAQELWAMLRAGVHPAGIAGGFASVATRPSAGTVVATIRRSTPNAELEDLTESVYEVRRLAMQRLVAEGRALKADGLLGVDLAIERSEAGAARLPGLKLSVHVFASAVRRVHPATVAPESVLALGARG